MTTIPRICGGDRCGTIAIGVGSTREKRDHAASGAICFANDCQLSQERRRKRPFTAGALLERISEIASQMGRGSYPMTKGFLVHLTDEFEEQCLDLVTKEVTIPELVEPVRASEEEPDWG